MSMASKEHNENDNDDNDGGGGGRGQTATTSQASKPKTILPSESDKMLAGALYDAFDAQLLQQRQRAKELCWQYNQINPTLTTERQDILRELFLGGNGGEDGRCAMSERSIDTMWIESPFYVDYGIQLRVGKNFYANHGCTILDCNSITIGDHCLLAPHVCISVATHPLSALKRAAGHEYTAPIRIGDNCWIGANATICPGVTLGNGVVVGAGAVVTKSFVENDNIVIGGVPAKILKYIQDDGDDKKEEC